MKKAMLGSFGSDAQDLQTKKWRMRQDKEAVGVLSVRCMMPFSEPGQRYGVVQ